VCWEICPEGYHDDGATCRKDASIISSDNSHCPWYDKCGLVSAKGCSHCPAGYNNDGCTCRRDAHIIGKKSHGRGAGTVPGYGCGAKDKDAGLCYTPCREGFHGVGPVCWSHCPAGFHDDGATCRIDANIVARPSYGRGVGTIPVLDHLSGILSKPRIHTVFWNDDSTMQTIKAKLVAFSSFLARDTVYPRQFAQYMRHGSFSAREGSVGTARGNASHGGVDLTEAGGVIGQAIDSGQVPPPGAFDDVYVLYLPPYKHINCPDCNALHSSWVYTGHGGSHIGYYLLVQTSSPGDGTLDSIDGITATTSHEYIEAVTDPICGGWYAGNCFTEEIADKCDSLGASSCTRNDGTTTWQVEPVYQLACGGCSCN
jgi:hypothetical protein